MDGATNMVLGPASQYEVTVLGPTSQLRDRSVFMTGGGAGDLNFLTTKIWNPIPLNFFSKNDYPTLNFLSKSGTAP